MTPAFAVTHHGQLGHERMTVKRFADSTLMHRWLNRRYDNDWVPYNGPLTAGTYAYVGGEWRNV